MKWMGVVWTTWRMVVVVVATTTTTFALPTGSAASSSWNDYIDNPDPPPVIKEDEEILPPPIDKDPKPVEDENDNNNDNYRDHYTPHVMFNHGVVEKGKSCTTDEWTYIMKLMEEATTATSSSLHHRSLLSFAPSQRQQQRQLGRCGCKYCWLSGGGCASKTTTDTDDRRRRSRQLGHGLRKTTAAAATTTSDSTTNKAYEQCKQDLLSIQKALDDMTTTMAKGLLLFESSSSCMALIESPRTMTCTIRIPCEIEMVHIWNVDNNEILYEDITASSGTPQLCTKDHITFQAIPTFDLGHITFTLYMNGEPELMYNSTDYSAPFFMHGTKTTTSDGTTILSGTYLSSAGEYTVHVYADNASHGKTIPLKVRDCTR